MKTFSTVSSLFLLAVCMPACDADSPAAATRVQEMLFVADGAFDPADTSEPPPTAEDIYRDALGFTDAELETRRQEAIAHYRESFGADVEDEANAMRLALVPFAVDPRIGYRAVEMNGEPLPGDGFTVHDAGWLLVVIDPSGFELGGDFAGQRVAAGPVAAFGDYGLEVDGEVERIAYHPVRPFAYDESGANSYSCALSSDVYGEGVAVGEQTIEQFPDGTVRIAIHNELEFEDAN